MDFPDQAGEFVPEPVRESTGPQPVIRQHQPVVRAKPTQYRYIVERVDESILSSVVLGSATMKTNKLQELINLHAASGYRMVFQIKEQKRTLFLGTRESIILTFEKAIS